MSDEFKNYLHVFEMISKFLIACVVLSIRLLTQHNAQDTHTPKGTAIQNSCIFRHTHDILSEFTQ